jgi:hypothetical protein
MLALVGVSCTYSYGAKHIGRPVSYSGIGWDSGIAYGDATAKARSESGDPARVQMNCVLYGIKPVVAGLIAGLAGGAAAANEKPEIALVAAPIVALVFLIPNCFATLTFDRADQESTSVRVRPNLTDRPMRKAPQPEPDAEESEPDPAPEAR